jgi:hypothetical protein
MPLADFLTDAGNGRYLYYTTALESWSPAGLDKHVNWSVFEVKEAEVRGSASSTSNVMPSLGRS